MARTSKRKVRLESQSLQESVLVKTYMAGDGKRVFEIPYRDYTV